MSIMAIPAPRFNRSTNEHTPSIAADKLAMNMLSIFSVKRARSKAL
jgi:hypothetical protein